MKTRLLAGLLLLTACDRTEPGAVREDRPAAGCADHLAVSLDAPSFEASGSSETDQLRWTEESNGAFKASADALCKSGAIAPAKFSGLKRLVVQYGAGADSAAVWEDEDQPGDVMLQYAFSPGAAAPDAADVRDAMLCWNAWDEALCARRLP